MQRERVAKPMGFQAPRGWQAVAAVCVVLGAYATAGAESAPTAAADAPAEAVAAAPDDGPLTGLQIATRADEVSRFKTERNVLTMTLENKRGQQRVRTIEGWSREISDDEEHRFSRFLEPSDVKDTTLLSYDYDQKDDDTWLFLPALKKVKRILTSNKDDYFMGSDFTYEDMENRDLVNWDYKLTGEETVDDVACYVVESTPNNDAERDESGYSKSVAWIGKDDFVARRVDLYDKKDRLAKRLLAGDIREVGSDPPKPRPHRLVMDNFITKHKTVLETREVQVDIPLRDDIFSQRNLRQ